MTTANDMQIYLSAALDQEACRETLCNALISRVVVLRQNGIEADTVIQVLHALCHDPYQINDDVILNVIDLIADGYIA
jgi:hypothetical protein